MISNFSTRLERWYETYGRDLPWRKTSDPYLIMLSEFILQQTQIVQGMSYYLRFAERFPTAQSLAEASEEAVMRMWPAPARPKPTPGVVTTFASCSSLSKKAHDSMPQSNHT